MQDIKFGFSFTSDQIPLKTKHELNTDYDDMMVSFFTNSN